MADLDTRLKRVSGINPSCPWRSQFPSVPSGTVDQAERQTAAYLYSGILAASPGGVFPYLGVSRSGMIGAGVI